MAKEELEIRLVQNIKALQAQREKLQDINAKKELDPSIQTLIEDYESLTGTSYNPQIYQD